MEGAKNNDSYESRFASAIQCRKKDQPQEQPATETTALTTEDQKEVVLNQLEQLIESELLEYMSSFFPHTEEQLKIFALKKKCDCKNVG